MYDTIQTIANPEAILQSQIHKNTVSKQVHNIIATLGDMSTKDRLILASALVAQGGFISIIGYGIFRGITG